MKLIVGLGNPGREYATTRHNVGWWAVDHLATAWGIGAWRKDGRALVASGKVNGVAVRLLKPQTFMNLSGAALVPYTRRVTWHATSDLLVIVDEVALPLGRLRLRSRGSAGGHNGLKSIEAAVGTQDYARLRIGIKPENPAHEIDDLADFVLAPFGRADAAVINALLARVREGVELWLREDVDGAMNFINAKAPPSEDEKTRGREDGEPAS